MTKGVDIDLWAFYQPVVGDYRDARASGAASMRVNIVGELYMLASYVVKHNSHPPVGVKKFDYHARSGLGWSF